MTYIVIRLVAVAGACLWLASGEQIAHATATSANVDSARLVRSAARAIGTSKVR